MRYQMINMQSVEHFLYLIKRQRHRTHVRFDISRSKLGYNYEVKSIYDIEFVYSIFWCIMLCRYCLQCVIEADSTKKNEDELCRYMMVIASHILLKEPKC